MRAGLLVSLTMFVLIGLASVPTSADEQSPSSTPSEASTAAPETTTPSDEPTSNATTTPEPSTAAADDSPGVTTTAADETGAAPHGAPFGAAYPVTLEANFARPYRSISLATKNMDFSQLDDLERIIRGTYLDPRTKKKRPTAEIRSNYVYMSVSRMENSVRVGRELVKAAKAGVKVRFIHPKSNQSASSRALQKALNAKGLRDSRFKLCSNGKSNACLSRVRGAIIHTKMLAVKSTFTRANKPALGVVWLGSPNLGGPSGARTYNNGITVYNDKKYFLQMRELFNDMYRKRNVNNDMPAYLKKAAKRYGYAGATADGYRTDYSTNGMLYSNLANVSIYPTPIYATPNNGKDPVLNLLRRIKPDSSCRVLVQHNRFKYRRIAVAYKLAELSSKGCDVELVAFQDDLAMNRKLHCQISVRVCAPILHVLKTANQRIPVAWAKPHDKVILVDALLYRNPANPYERGVDGSTWTNWGGVACPPLSSGATASCAGTVRTKLVQTGSAGLTGSNLVGSDEASLETTDATIYDQYLEHWQAILRSHEYKNYPY